MKKEEAFGHAVQLAAAFVANGDIRITGDPSPSSPEMTKLRDLLDSLNTVVHLAFEQAEDLGEG
jgi:hypothetical protein